MVLAAVFDLQRLQTYSQRQQRQHFFRIDIHAVMMSFDSGSTATNDHITHPHNIVSGPIFYEELNGAGGGLRSPASTDVFTAAAAAALFPHRHDMQRWKQVGSGKTNNYGSTRQCNLKSNK
eukprot:scaffold18127_cov77-Skeletonema_dohrnii-CCMP3373.AAC.1